MFDTPDATGRLTSCLEALRPAVSPSRLTAYKGIPAHLDWLSTPGPETSGFPNTPLASGDFPLVRARRRVTSADRQSADRSRAGPHPIRPRPDHTLASQSHSDK